MCFLIFAGVFSCANTPVRSIHTLRSLHVFPTDICGFTVSFCCLSSPAPHRNVPRHAVVHAGQGWCVQDSRIQQPDTVRAVIGRRQRPGAHLYGQEGLRLRQEQLKYTGALHGS